jgi:hypothetical protein
MRLASLLPAVLAVLLLAGAAAFAQEDTAVLDQLIAEAEALKFDSSAERNAIAVAQSRANVARFNLGTALGALGGSQQGIDDYRFGDGALIPISADGVPIEPRSLVDAQGLKIFNALVEAGASPDELLRVITLLNPEDAFSAGEWTESDIAFFKRHLDSGAIKLEQFYALAVLLDHEVTMHDEALEAVLDRELAYASKLAEVEAERERLEEARAAEAKIRDALRLADLELLTHDAASADDAMMLVEDRTGLPVLEFKLHLSARLATEGVIYYCPPSDRKDVIVDGTDRYNARSGLCHAAIHAGAITRAGGFVRVRHFPADSSFELVGSTRHGITSTAFGSEQPTFSFVPVLQ